MLIFSLTRFSLKDLSSFYVFEEETLLDTNFNVAKDANCNFSHNHTKLLCVVFESFSKVFGLLLSKFESKVLGTLI